MSKFWGDRQVVKVNGNGKQCGHSHQVVGRHFLFSPGAVAVFLSQKTLPVGNTHNPTGQGTPDPSGKGSVVFKRRHSTLRLCRFRDRKLLKTPVFVGSNALSNTRSFAAAAYFTKVAFCDPNICNILGNFFRFFSKFLVAPLVFKRKKVFYPYFCLKKPRRSVALTPKPVRAPPIHRGNVQDSVAIENVRTQSWIFDLNSRLDILGRCPVFPSSWTTQSRKNRRAKMFSD